MQASGVDLFLFNISGKKLKSKYRKYRKALRLEETVKTILKIYLTNYIKIKMHSLCLNAFTQISEMEFNCNKP